MNNWKFWCLIIGVLFVVSSCKETPSSISYYQLQGKTMGTTYSITYGANSERDLKPKIDSLLQAINEEVSTYIPTSTISSFNQSEEHLQLDPQKHGHFLLNWKAAKKVFSQSKGAFDPTVMPLVNYWGFGYDGKKKVSQVDSVKVDSLKKMVGLEQLELTEDFLLKKPFSGMQLDFSACAKGYGVDAVCIFLNGQGIDHFLVEIGREVRARGLNSKKLPWNIGIALPKEGAGATEIQTVIPLQNASIATSGNYQNYYEVDGIKYAHTINPETGFPEKNKLLSASVISGECMLADAYATTFMVLGLEKSYALATELNGVEAYFIYGDDEGGMKVKFTDGLKDIFPQ